MDYSEIRFIMAEAALKGWIDGGEAQARVYYESAVKASCQKWAELERYSDVKAPIDDNAIAKLLAGRLAGWDSHTDKERLIAEQKYLSLFWVGLEAYHELRRTSWPETHDRPRGLVQRLASASAYGLPIGIGGF